MSNTYSTKKVNTVAPQFNQQLTVSNGGSGSYTYNTAIIPSPVLTVSNNKEKGSLTVNGNIIFNEVDLEERLRTMEKILNIPERDPNLEKKYPKLKKMYDEYIKELSKARMWESLKGEQQ
jgi:hypothetical protein